MKVYIVFNDIQEGGVELFHIASSKENADSWIKDFNKEHPNSVYRLEVYDIDVDEKERIVL